MDNIKEIGAIHPCHIPDKKFAESSGEYEPSPGIHPVNKNRLTRIIIDNFIFLIEILFNITPPSIYH